MAYEHKENRGSVFNNDKKEKDTHPDQRGSANIGGKLYWVSAWKQKTNGGDEYLSLSFQEQEEKQHDANQGSHDADQGSGGGGAPSADGGFENIPFGPIEVI